MPATCKGCDRGVRNCYYCSVCDNTYHKGCGKFKTKPSTDGSEDTIICFECIAKNLTLGPRGLNELDLVSLASGSSFNDDDDEVLASQVKDAQKDSDTGKILGAIKEQSRTLRQHINNTISAFRKDMTSNFTKVNKSILDMSAKQNKQETEMKIVKHDVASLQEPQLTIAGYDGATDSPDDMKNFILALAKHVQVELSLRHIRRVIVRNNGSLLVTFYFQGHVQMLLDARTSFRQIMYSDIIKNSVSTKQVFINPMLSADSYNLLRETKIWAKKVNCKFVWHSGSKILIRRNEGEKAIQIESSEQLAKLGHKFKTPAAPAAIKISSA